MTTVNTLRRWLKEGQAKKATHMIVVCETFSYTDFPVYVMAGENVRDLYEKHNNGQMSKVMVVYNLNQDIEKQLASDCVKNF